MDQISYQKQVIRDEYINQDTSEYSKQEHSNNFQLSPKQFKKTKMLNAPKSEALIPWFNK